jgi:hypothetical protein
MEEMRAAIETEGSDKVRNLNRLSIYVMLTVISDGMIIGSCSTALELVIDLSWSCVLASLDRLPYSKA